MPIATDRSASQDDQRIGSRAFARGAPVAVHVRTWDELSRLVTATNSRAHGKLGPILGISSTGSSNPRFL